MKDERRVRLQTIVREKGANFIYEYDFGDGWRYRVTVEDIWPRTENSLVPRYLMGSEPARRKIVGASVATSTSSRRYEIDATRNTENGAHGLAHILTRNCFPFKPSTPP